MKIVNLDSGFVSFEGPLVEPARSIGRGVAVALVPGPVAFVPSAPAAFGLADWSLSTGLATGQVVLNIAALPADGGSAITAIQYNIGAGWVAISGVGTGPRTLAMATPNAGYTFALRAINALGAGASSATKTVTSAAETAPTAPAAFATTDWSVATGPAANQVVITINNVPSDGGSAITSLQYSNGGTWTNLSGTGVGDYVLDMPAAGTEYPIRVRTRNAIGISGPGVTKTVLSGAAATAPVAITSAQPTAQRVYQRSSDTGGVFSLGEGSVGIGVTVDRAVSSLQYRLRDAGTAAVLVDWATLSGALAAGTHALSANCPARLGQYLIDVRANGDSASIATGTNPFAVGAVILSAGQSQVMRTFGVVGGAAAPIAASGAAVPTFGRVFGTYFDAQRTSSTPSWVAPADGTAYDSPFIPVFLAAEQARRGVTCAYVGCGVGASIAAEWVPGQQNWTRLLVSVNEVDAWESLIWHLGGSDATGATTAASYMASLNSILTALDGLNGRGSDYDAVICAMGSRTTGDWVDVARIRQAAKDVAEARAGAIYAEPRDVDLVDTVHQSDAGNVRLARSMSRHLAAAAAGAIAGPAITGATLNGTALTLAVTHAPGATALVATGDITTRLAVYPAGYVPTTGTTGRLAISAATVTANAINITLASAPTTDVDVYVYPHPDTTGTTLSARVIADNYTADGIPHGRQALPTTDAPVTAAYTGAVTPPTYPALTTTAGTPAYTGGRFGQAMNPNGTFYASAPGPLRPAGRVWGFEGWVRMPTAARSNIAMGESGVNSAYMVVRNGGNSPLGQACISYEMADRTVIHLTGGPRIDDNQWHHVAVQFHDAGARLYVDGVQVATSTSLISSSPAELPFSVGSFGNAGSAFIWTGQIDEVRLWNGLEITAAFTPRTSAYTALTAGTIAYWAFENTLSGGFVTGTAPPASEWTPLVPTNGGPQGAAAAFFRGIVTPDGSNYRVTTASDSTNGRAAYPLPAAGTVVTMETSIAFGDATRIICRQVGNNDSTSGITVNDFDVNRPAPGAVLTRSDTFTVAGGVTLLHFIGVTAAGQFFTINAATRLRIGA